ncbi:MAG: helix-turn-helix transcriptional regulator [Actinobacteria bacterium]|nr:helix-turn-helix transcriptional regulator [Actinomycetota bacterium]
MAMKTANTNDVGNWNWPAQVSETAVLVLLKQRWRHGYGLHEQLRELGVPVGDLSRLYRSLRKLEDEGIVTSRWDTEAPRKGPARRIYTLTRQGNRYLRQRIDTLRLNTDVMNRIRSRYVDVAERVA